MRPAAVGLLSILAVFILLPHTASAGEIHAFVYHRFGDSRYPSTNIALDVFESQLQLLRDGNWTVLSLGEVVRRMRSGAELPQRCAVLTIDDAFESFLKGGVPLLRRYGFPATLFVNTAAIGTPGNVDWVQLRALAVSGIEIGNQTVTHPYLLDRRNGETRDQWRLRIRGELRQAQTILQDRLGKAPTLFAYPYGEYDPEVQDLVRDAGFSAAVAQTSGVITPQSDLFALPRFPMGGRLATVEEFARKLDLHALPVTVIEPRTPVLDDERLPPLIVAIAPDQIDLSRLQCFIDGSQRCSVRRLDGAGNRWLVTSDVKVRGRRVKCTLTAPGAKGWYWFTQLWIRPERSGAEPAAVEAGDADTHR